MLRNNLQNFARSPPVTVPADAPDIVVSSAGQRAQLTSSDNNTSVAVPAFTAQHAIKIDRKLLLAEIQKSFDAQYEPLLSKDLVRNPFAQRLNKVLKISSASELSIDPFDRLFKKASEQFQLDAEPIVLDQLQPDGRIYKYAQSKKGSEKKKLLLAMNDFFGMVLSLPSTKRRQALDALLTMPDGDLNCSDGMVQRLDFIKTALTDNSPFLTQAFADVERAAVFGDQAVVEIHNAHAQQKKFRDNLTQEHGKAIEQKAVHNIEHFLDTDIRTLLDDLTEVVAKGVDTQSTVDALKQCQEKHTPTLQWFFPPKETVSQDNAASHTTQLYQHADYFDLDEDQINFAVVKQENIVRDAIKIALPVLTPASRILVALKNPGYWPTLSPLLFPELIAKTPSLTYTTFVNEILRQTFLPAMVGRGNSIADLIRAEAIGIDACFEPHGWQPSLLAQVVEKERDCQTLEMLYLHHLESGQSGDQYQRSAKLLAYAPPVRALDRNIKEMLVVDTMTDSAIRQFVTRLKADFNKIETQEFKIFATKKVSHAFQQSFNKLIDQKKLTLLKTLNTDLTGCQVPFELFANFAKTSLETVMPAQTRLQTSIHSCIVDQIVLLDKQRATDSSFDSERMLDLSIELTDKMADLHAATLRSGAIGLLHGELSPGQNPQTKAYKLIKRQLQAYDRRPDAGITLIKALLTDNRLERLNKALRTLTGRQWKRVIEETSLILLHVTNPLTLAMELFLVKRYTIAAWKNRRRNPLMGIQGASIRQIGNYLLLARGLMMSTAPESRVQNLTKLHDTWQLYLQKINTFCKKSEPREMTLAQSERIGAIATGAVRVDAKSTDVNNTETKNRASITTPLDTQSLYIWSIMLAVYVEELDARNYTGALSVEELAAEKTKTLNTINVEHIVVLTNRLYCRSKVAYVELIEYLIARDGRAGFLTEERIADIAVKIDRLSNLQKISPEKLSIWKNLDADSLFRSQEKIVCGIQRIKAALPGLAVAAGI
jgi:hypothetical protein